ncbi:MAG: hypothetical protein IJW40_01830 [Clostridia bacterium]|nr:hypothetical protein [Clostridia bacterium]
MKQISLNGTWKCKHAGGYRGGEGEWPGLQRWMPSYDITVPGTVQEALEHLTGDVHYAHNVLNARWIEEETWLLTRTFTLCAEDLADGKRARMVFEGLDLYATVFINGKRVGEHHNFYTPYRLDVTDHVIVGENKLDIKLESGLLANAFKSAGGGHGYQREQAMRRNYCRRPQSAYEWDWSPRLLNVGIFRPCYIEIGHLFVDEASIFHDLNDDNSEATLRIRQFLSLPTERTVRVAATVVETGESAVWENTAQGNPYAPLTLSVKNPKLWQPRNHGEPYRYTVRLTVTDVATGETVSTVDRKVGLRRVEIDQSPLKQGGRLFRLMVNGHQVFAKGANMVPLDILFSRLTRDAYKTVIDRAVEANFNALRVWGGGVYETDDFYDLCDENGIVVWQDFIGACANYPANDRDFVDNYRAEIAYNLRRMSPYASAVIYCGNNEIDWQMQAGYLLHTYTCAALYYSMVPKIMYAEGDNHYYQPSSPYSPDGSDANSNAVGDQHPWQIGFGNRDYFQYRQMDSRFPNEGGILGPTSLPNMMAALGEGQQFMHSFDFKVHDNSIADQERCAPERLLEEKLGMVTGLHEMSIPDYVYYGGFLQGEGLTEYILNFRRRMSTTTDSAIFWMYEDCWPATRSWTIVDYLRNRTPSFYPVKRAFSPIVLDIVSDGKGGFDLYGINEYLTEQSVTLCYAAVAPDAKGADVIWTQSSVTLPANASTVIAHLDAPAGTIPCAMLTDADGTLLARRRWVDRPYNTLGLCKSDIRVSVNGNTATYESDTLVLGVCLDLDGDDGNLSDNFFDLYPGVPYTVTLGSKNGEVLYHL